MEEEDTARDGGGQSSDITFYTTLAQHIEMFDVTKKEVVNTETENHSY